MIDLSLPLTLIWPNVTKSKLHWHDDRMARAEGL